MKNFVISKEAQDIVEKFVSKTTRKKDSSWLYAELAVSLYDTMPFSVLDVVRDSNVSCYLTDLSGRLSSNEIQVLQSDYTAVVKYCYERKQLGGGTRGVMPNACFVSQEDSNTPNGRRGRSYASQYDGFHMSSSLIYLIHGLSKSDSSIQNTCLDSNVIIGQFVQDRHYFDCIEDNDMLECIDMDWSWWRILFSELDSKVNYTSEKNCCKRMIQVLPFMDNIQHVCGALGGFFVALKNMLCENGEMFCVMPLQYLSSNVQGNEFIKNLSGNEGYSSMVIELPRCISPYPQMDACLLCINKDGKSEIELVDFSEIESDWKNPLKVDVSSILEIIQKRDTRYVFEGGLKDVECNHHLIPSYYVLMELNLKKLVKQDERLVRLGDLVEEVTLKSAQNRSSRCKHIGVSDLSSKYMTSEILYSEELETKDALTKRRLKEDCLLACFYNGKMLVGYTSGLSKDNCVALSSFVVPFRIKKEAGVTQEYMLKSLVSPDTQKQALSMLKGSNLRNLSDQEFWDLQIILPSVESQEKIFKKEVSSSLSEADKKLQEEFEAFRKDMHVKKHAIGQTIFDFNNWMKVLNSVRRKSNGVLNDNSMVGVSDPIRVSEIFDNIQNVVNKLQVQIEKFDRGNQCRRDSFSLTEFVKKYMVENQSPIFRYQFDELLMTGDDANDYVDFSKEALTIILDNIKSNACCHGFKREDPSMNVIRIVLYNEGLDSVLMVSNNGKPIIGDFSEEDVFAYSITSSEDSSNHYGIGGYEIARLMREFGGEAKLILSSQEDFPVSYKLIFHNTKRSK